ncbi:MAG TPA: hypothetical protein ENF16_03750 [Bacteroidetes bacterium]|nr:hypothetical protein [Bacteroidota bacterium]
MSTMLDMVGSFIIGGLLLMMILNVNANFNMMSTENRLDLMVQENLAELIEEIEFDFRKIGYGVQNPSLSIISADTSSISFWADLDNDGTLDQVSYTLGPTSDVFGTVNPRDRILYRSINGTQTGGSLGVVDFQLTLYDISGTQTTDPTLVKSLDYYLLLESPFPMDTTYARSAWTGTVHPKNL